MHFFGFARVVCSPLFLSITLLGLFGCTRPDHQVSHKPEAKYTETADYYSASLIYSSDKSDSLLLGNGDFEKTVRAFRAQGTKVKEQEYGGGDCWGRYKRFVLNGDTLTIDKTSCGEYGFSNRQFLNRADSIVKVRKFDMQWSAYHDTTIFDVTEKIYTFRQGQLTIIERAKTAFNWNDTDLRDIEFQSRTSEGQQAYADLEMELKDLLSSEIIQE